MKTPDYQLIEDHVIYSGNDPVRIAAGSFVRPVELRYVPAHVLEDPRFQHRPADTVFCHCWYGMVLIPRSKLKTV